MFVGITPVGKMLVGETIMVGVGATFFERNGSLFCNLNLPVITAKKTMITTSPSTKETILFRFSISCKTVYSISNPAI